MVVQFRHRKAKDSYALAFEPLVAKGVVSRLIFVGVDRPVEFDAQPRRRAVKVEDVDAQGVLATEAEAGELFAAQQRPEHRFRSCGRLAGSSGSFRSEDR